MNLLGKNIGDTLRYQLRVRLWVQMREQLRYQLWGQLLPMINRIQERLDELVG